eukprot:TRINITY_DN18041_c0_g1_i2.p1 TRINITY_DN18041_c0_g1~~TRINITY_DN18041_c0_g1_i2.p1  ORF type:complete len:230 (+),score=32.28 TRINITY_DN18041_c0_g1_i2:91-780(+)
MLSQSDHQCLNMYSAMTSPSALQFAGFKRFDSQDDVLATTEFNKKFRRQPLFQPSYKRRQSSVISSDELNALDEELEAFELHPKRSKRDKEPWQMEDLTASLHQSQTSQHNHKQQGPCVRVPLLDSHNCSDDDDETRPSLLHCLQRASRAIVPDQLVRQYQAEAQRQGQCFAIVPYQSKDKFISNICHPKVDPVIEDPDDAMVSYHQASSPIIEEIFPEEDTTMDVAME